MLLSSLPTLVQEVVGFFIVESHVLRTTRGFRSEREVEDLWESVVARVGEGMEQALANETNPDVFLDVKESLIAFSATLEVSMECDALPNVNVLFSRVTRTLPSSYILC